MSTEYEQTDEMTDVEPDEFSKMRRLRSIHNARDEVMERQKKVDDLTISGQIRHDTGLKALRRAVERYILEVETLVLSDEHSVERDYWEGVELGSFKLPNGEVRKYQGLKSLLEEDEVITAEWTEVKRSKENSQEQVTKRETVAIPRDILIKAYREVNNFLAEVGLDISLEREKTKTYGFRGEVVKLDE